MLTFINPEKETNCLDFPSVFLAPSRLTTPTLELEDEKKNLFTIRHYNTEIQVPINYLQALNDGITNLLELLRKKNPKPSWIHILRNKYHKGIYCELLDNGNKIGTLNGVYIPSKDRWFFELVFSSHPRDRIEFFDDTLYAFNYTILKPMLRKSYGFVGTLVPVSEFKESYEQSV